MILTKCSQSAQTRLVIVVTASYGLLVIGRGWKKGLKNVGKLHNATGI